MPKLKGYRTVLLMLAGITLQVVNFLSPEMLATALGLTPQDTAITTIALFVIGVALRAVTNTRIGKSS